MYSLACEIGVDSIVFSGLSFLKAEGQMTEAETVEMMALYERVLRSDHYERIAAITDLKQDLSPRVRAMNARLDAEAPRTAALHKIVRLLRRNDLGAREKVGLLWERLTAWRRTNAGEVFDERCLIGKT